MRWKYALLLLVSQLTLEIRLLSESTNSTYSISDSNKLYQVTAYCNNSGKGCEICNGNWACLNKTASGETPIEGITCAAPRNIEFGTQLLIEGVGLRIVQDRNSQRFDNHITVYFDKHSDAKQFGLRQLKVKFLKKDEKRV